MSYGTDRHRRTLEDVNDAAENRRTRSEVRNKWTQTRREEEDEFHQMVEEHLQEQKAGEAERERRANVDASSTECG